jgi:hypothetical protein
LEWKSVESDLINLIKTPQNGSNPDQSQESNGETSPLPHTTPLTTNANDEPGTDQYDKVYLSYQWSPVFIGFNTPQSTQPMIPSHDYLLGNSPQIWDNGVAIGNIHIGELSQKQQLEKQQHEHTYRLIDLLNVSSTTFNTHNPTDPNNTPSYPISYTITSLYALLIHISSSHFYSTQTTLRQPNPLQILDPQSPQTVVEELQLQLTLTKDLINTVHSVRSDVTRGTQPIIYRCLSTVTKLIALLFQINGDCFYSNLVSPIKTPLQSAPTHATFTQIQQHNIHYRNHVYWIVQALSLAVFDFALLSQLFLHLQQTTSLLSYYSNPSTQPQFEEPHQEIITAGNEATKLLFLASSLLDPYIFSTIPSVLPKKKIIDYSPPNQVSLFSSFLDFDWLKTALITTLTLTLPTPILTNNEAYSVEYPQLSQFIAQSSFQHNCTIQSTISILNPNQSLTKFPTQSTFSWVTGLGHIFTTILLSQLYPNLQLHNTTFLSTAYYHLVYTPTQSFVSPTTPPLQTALFTTSPISQHVVYSSHLPQQQPQHTQPNQQYVYLPFAHSSDEMSLQLNFTPRVTNIAFKFYYHHNQSQAVLPKIPQEQLPQGDGDGDGDDITQFLNVPNYSAQFPLPMSAHKQIIAQYTSQTSWCGDMVALLRDITHNIAVQYQNVQDVAIKYIFSLDENEQKNGFFWVKNQFPDLDRITSSSTIISLLSTQFLQQYSNHKKHNPQLIHSNVEFGELLNLTTPTMSIFNVELNQTVLDLTPAFIQHVSSVYLNTSLLSAVPMSSFVGSFDTQTSANSSNSNQNNQFDDDYHHDNHDDNQAINDYIDDTYTYDIITSLSMLLRTDFSVSISMLTNLVKLLTQHIMIQHSTLCSNPSQTNPPAQLDLLESLTLIYKITRHLLHNSSIGESTSIPHELLSSLLFNHQICSLLLQNPQTPQPPSRFAALPAPLFPIELSLQGEEQWAELLFDLPNRLFDFSSVYIEELLPRSFQHNSPSYTLTAISTIDSDKCICLSSRLLTAMIDFLLDFSSTFVPLLNTQYSSPQQSEIFSIQQYGSSNPSQNGLTDAKLAALNQERFMASSLTNFFHPKLCLVFSSYHYFQLPKTKHLNHFPIKLIKQILNISQMLLLLWSEDRNVVYGACALITKIIPLLFQLTFKPEIILSSLVSFSNLFSFSTMATRLFQPILTSHWQNQKHLIEHQISSTSFLDAFEAYRSCIELAQNERTAPNFPQQLLQFPTLPPRVLSVLHHKQSKLDEFLRKTNQPSSSSPLLLYTLIHYDDNSIFAIGNLIQKLLSQSFDISQNCPTPTQIIQTQELRSCNNLAPLPTNHIHLSLLRDTTVSLYQQIILGVVTRHQLLMNSNSTILSLQKFGHLVLFSTTHNFLSNLSLPPRYSTLIGSSGLSTTPLPLNTVIPQSLLNSHPNYITPPQLEIQTHFFSRFPALVGAILSSYGPALLQYQAQYKKLLNELNEQDMYPLIFGNLVQITTLLSSPLSQQSSLHYALLMSLLNDYLAVIVALLQPSILDAEKYPVSTDLIRLIEQVLALFARVFTQFSFTMSYIVFSLLATTVTMFITVLTRTEALKLFRNAQILAKLDKFTSQIHNNPNSLNLSYNHDDFPLNGNYNNDGGGGGGDGDGDSDDDESDQLDVYNQFEKYTSDNTMTKRPIYTSLCDIISNILHRTASDGSEQRVALNWFEQLSKPISAMTTDLKTMTQTLSESELEQNHGVIPTLLFSDIFFTFKYTKAYQQHTGAPVEISLIPTPLYTTILLSQSLTNVLVTLQAPPSSTLTPNNLVKYNNYSTNPTVLNLLQTPLMIARPDLTHKVLQALTLTAKETFKYAFVQYATVKPTSSTHSAHSAQTPLVSLFQPMFEFVLQCLRNNNQFVVQNDDIIKHSFIFLSTFLNLHLTFLKQLLIPLVGSRLKSERQFVTMVIDCIINDGQNPSQFGFYSPPGSVICVGSKGYGVPLPTSHNDNKILIGNTTVTIDASSAGLLLLNITPQLLRDYIIAKYIPTQFFVQNYCWPIMFSALFSSQINTTIQPLIVQNDIKTITQLISSPHDKLIIPHLQKLHQRQHTTTSHPSTLLSSTTSQDINGLFFQLLLSLTAPDDMIVNIAHAQRRAVAKYNLLLSPDEPDIPNNPPTPMQQIAQHWMPFYMDTRSGLISSVFGPIGMLYSAQPNTIPFYPEMVQIIIDFFDNIFVLMLKTLTPVSPASSGAFASALGAPALTPSQSETTIFLPLNREQLQQPKMQLGSTVNFVGNEFYTPYPYSLFSDSRHKRKVFYNILTSLLTQLSLK